MIVGIGIDLVSISDFSHHMENPAFLKRVFSEREIQYCQSYKSSIEHFAGKFAAKEAFMKAIGKGIRQEIWFSQIEILNHASGAPYFSLHGKAQEALETLEVSSTHLSISHSKENAVSMVILESLDL
ncbi:holo-ACP synthase [bacterium]|nr:holo-ACP synthase [bacterium]